MDLKVSCFLAWPTQFCIFLIHYFKESIFFSVRCQFGVDRKQSHIIVIPICDYFLWRNQNFLICGEFCSMCWMAMIFLGQVFRSFCAVYLRSLRNTMLSALNCLHNTTTLHLWYFAHVSCVKLFIALIFQTQQHKMLLLIGKQLGVSLGNAASTNWTLIPGLKLMKRHKLLRGITLHLQSVPQEKNSHGFCKSWENSLCRQHLWSFIKVYFFFMLICSISQY